MRVVYGGNEESFDKDSKVEMEKRNRSERYLAGCVSVCILYEIQWWGGK